MDMYIAYRLEHLLQELDLKLYPRHKIAWVWRKGQRGKVEKSTDMWIDTFRGFGQKWPVGGIPCAATTVDEFHALLDGLRGELLEYGVAPASCMTRQTNTPLPCLLLVFNQSFPNQLAARGG